MRFRELEFQLVFRRVDRFCSGCCGFHGSSRGGKKKKKKKKDKKVKKKNKKKKKVSGPWIGSGGVAMGYIHEILLS